MTVVSGHGRVLVGGKAEGEVLRCTQAISGWGGIDPKTGAIVETRHPQRGSVLTGKILVIPGAKGSSGWSGQFHIAKVLGTQPAAIITSSMNSKLALGLQVLGVPALIEVDDRVHAALQDGARARIDDGRVKVWVQGEETGDDDV
ncbi:aconitase X swivel domain-containing protein [Microbacterium sp.]|uniref:aconitase X swivel domain-containing protein n=1 Tax=Microbacterium sp. TaxID=51671 RepID=UPI002BF0D545|nr:DUF126 domain-containing protein [Microbacterium sp.]HWK76282.1 DUF126 domain-containing protein [Microbacterium sp.]